MKEKPKSLNNEICLVIKVRIQRFVVLQVIHVYVNKSILYIYIYYIYYTILYVEIYNYIYIYINNMHMVIMVITNYTFTLSEILCLSSHSLSYHKCT